MSLISCQSIQKTFGTQRLFDSVSLTIAENDRLGVIGPNGSGKSTLMQILAGVQHPDSGVVSYRKGIRVGYVPQETTFDSSQTVRSVAESALVPLAIDEEEREARINVVLGKAGFAKFADEASSLSGGWRKRLAIARELLLEPHVLLLDEPTNHLDLDGIIWLERLLAASSFTSVVVSHDRYFLENFATDILEINRLYPEGLFRSRGNYSEFLLKREEFRSAQAQYRTSLENRVRREVEWLRRGPKARTTKAKARIDAAGRMIDELGELQASTSEAAVRIDFSASGRKTKRLISAGGLSKSLGGKALFSSLDLVLTPGLRLGLVGPNGSGKTTLLRILAGELEQDAGSLERAESLRIVYFDQHRRELDPEVTLRRSLCPHGDSVIYNDRPVHVAGWAKRFLFRNDQLDMPVGRLSGGERARVVIARLMLQPADLLLLDEPTNDLDIPTLEVLEDSLLDFSGALVLVTHDRYLLDRVSTMVLAIGPGQGTFADYSQWEQARREENRKLEPKLEQATRATADVPARKRLSYMEAREWEGIEERIQAAEGKLQLFQATIQDMEVARDPLKLQEVYARMQEAEAEVDRLYQRWAELAEKTS